MWSRPEKIEHLSQSPASVAPARTDGMDRGERHAGPEEVFACRFPEVNSCGRSVWYDLGAGLFWGGGTDLV